VSEQKKVRVVRVIDTLWTFAVAVAFLGPFALPLLWRNPRFTWKSKIAGSIFVVLFTVGLMWFTGTYLSAKLDELQMMLQVIQDQQAR